MFFIANLYVFSSIPDQGKTTTAILLEKKLKREGKKVACLQTNKGPNDVFKYLSEGCYHYSIPLEAAKNKEAFEKWVPCGYDAYIMEISTPYFPIGAAYADVFSNINEVVSHEVKEKWRDFVADYSRHFWKTICTSHLSINDLMVLWDIVRDRNLQTIITKTPTTLKGPNVDREKQLNNSGELVRETIDPQMKLPAGQAKTIAVGTFPAEFWDIYPDIQWFGLDYAGFMSALRRKQYDLAIIGACGSNSLKLKARPDHGTIICYQPSVYLELQERRSLNPLTTDFQTIFNIIKTQQTGAQLVNSGVPYSSCNNRYWVRQKYADTEPVWKKGNLIFCDGWVHPRYLIRDGFLEVN